MTHLPSDRKRGHQYADSTPSSGALGVPLRGSQGGTLWSQGWLAAPFQVLGPRRELRVPSGPSGSHEGHHGSRGQGGVVVWVPVRSPGSLEEVIGRKYVARGPSTGSWWPAEGLRGHHYPGPWTGEGSRGSPRNGPPGTSWTRLPIVGSGRAGSNDPPLAETGKTLDVQPETGPTSLLVPPQGSGHPPTSDPRGPVHWWRGEGSPLWDWGRRRRRLTPSP